MAKFDAMTKEPDFLTVAQAAEELSLSRRALAHRIKAGTVAATKLGDGRTSAYVIARDEVERVKGEMRAAS